MRLFNRKGTEKPIEIFLALFVILAVSMVMLKMFQGQITDKQEQMKEINRDSELEGELNDAVLVCKELCGDSVENKCSAQTVSAFCAKKFNLDYNKDQAISFNSEKLGGVGLCEDQVHCFHIYPSCTCGQQLTAEYCKQKMCEYWNSQGLDANEIASTIFKNDSDACKHDPNYNADIMWNKNILTNSCTP